MQMTGWVSTNTIAVLHRKVQPLPRLFWEEGKKKFLFWKWNNRKLGAISVCRCLTCSRSGWRTSGSPCHPSTSARLLQSVGKCTRSRNINRCTARRNSFRFGSVQMFTFGAILEVQWCSSKKWNQNKTFLGGSRVLVQSPGWRWLLCSGRCGGEDEDIYHKANTGHTALLWCGLWRIKITA